MSDLVAEFVRDLPNQVNRIAELLRREHLEDLRRVVHQLKGAGGGYGFAPITAEAARTEQIIRTGQDLAEIQTAVTSLLELLRRVEGFQPTFSQSQAQPSQTMETT
jgi:HPt (histidine-containing phosphotransfer) domain-containing protein